MKYYWYTLSMGVHLLYVFVNHITNCANVKYGFMTLEIVVFGRYIALRHCTSLAYITDDE